MDMRMRARIALAVALTLAAAAGCSSQGLTGGTSSGGTSSGGTSSGGTSSGGGTNAASSLDCGGKVTNLASALRLVTDPAGCPGAVNTLWRKTSGVGDLWTTPKFIAYHDGQVPDDACGRAAPNPRDFAENAAYCPADDTIVYSIELLDQLYRSGGPYQPVLVLDHELGHRANHLARTVGRVSRAEENQADCDAGYAVRFAHDAGRLPISDVFSGGLLFFSLGDKGGSWFNTENPAAPGAHGTPRQRATAYADGYLRGVKRCRSIGKSRTGSIIL
jgi:uncharacterized protein